MARFAEAIDKVLSHEGGYVNDPTDPGGETKYGISRRSYPDLDIANLTREQAIAIYKRDWWDKLRIALISDQQVAELYFDFAVNMGARSAGLCVQRALRAVGVEVEQDGHVGPATRAAIRDLHCAGWGDDHMCSLAAAIRSEAAGHYRELVERNPALGRFLKGWLNRAYGTPGVTA